MAGGWVFETAGFNASMDALMVAVDAATRDAVVTGSELIEKAAKESFGPAHSKGTPKTVFNKPQSITGTLRRSIKTWPPFSPTRGIWRARVAPTVIYGRRIELGYHGVDSLGRDYGNPGQPPYPYMQPGVDKASPFLNGLFAIAWNAAMGA